MKNTTMITIDAYYAKIGCFKFRVNQETENILKHNVTTNNVVLSSFKLTPCFYLSLQLTLLSVCPFLAF